MTKTFVDSAHIKQLWWHYHRQEHVTPRVMRDRLRALASKLLRTDNSETFVTLFSSEAYSLGEALFDVASSASRVRVYCAKTDDEYRELTQLADRAILLPVPSNHTRLVRCWYDDLSQGALRTEVKNKSVLDLSYTYRKYF